MTEPQILKRFVAHFFGYTFHDCIDRGLLFEIVIWCALSCSFCLIKAGKIVIINVLVVTVDVLVIRRVRSSITSDNKKIFKKAKINTMCEVVTIAVTVVWKSVIANQIHVKEALSRLFQCCSNVVLCLLVKFYKCMKISSGF